MNDATDMAKGMMNIAEQRLLFLFEHVFADPAEFPNRWARVVAEEVSTNEWVLGPLPGHPVWKIFWLSR